MKKILLIVLSFICFNAYAALTDVKFGQYQIADSQWNVSSCLYTTTCQIYSKQPGTAYKIPWTSGQLSWAAGDYVKFDLTGDAANPYLAKQYSSNGSVKDTLGTGHIVNMGADYFFFVGNDNNTGQLFSGSSGMNSTAGVTWTGTLNPTLSQADSYATANYSTTPLAAGQTAAVTPSGPDWKFIRNTGTPVYITKITPLVSNSPGAEQPSKAFDGSVGSKYLHLDKANSGITITLSQGRVIEKMTLTTANDSPGRDPTQYRLYGSNNGVTWTLIKDQAISLSDNRNTVSSDIMLNNTKAYVHYHIVFPQNKYGDCTYSNDCKMVQIAEITFYYDNNNTLTNSDLSNGTVIGPAPPLCCGGSAAPFSANYSNQLKINAFTTRTTGDSQVYIEQIGNSNTIIVDQSGTKNNYVEYFSNGSYNIVNIAQTGNSNTTANYIEANIGSPTSSSNSNIVNLTQNSTGGIKSIFVNIADSNNSLTIQQRDSGSHYAAVTLSGGNKNVNILQQGSAAHMANINLGGAPTTLDLTQSGATQQFYSISHTCATAAGCGTITVNQGQ